MKQRKRYTVDYQTRDHELLDYGLWEAPGLPGLWFRGPALDLASSDGHITCLGAAQTFGVYVDNPFPQLLSQRFGLPVWNLGVGGADPGFFLEHPALFPLINRSSLVICQIMTARSSPNDRMSRSRVAGMAGDTERGDHVVATDIWRRLLDDEPDRIEHSIAQSRQSWHRDVERLISMIEVPRLDFWFSPKPLDRPVDVSKTSSVGMIDVYPQFVTGADLDVLGDAAPLVACHSSRNQRFPLRSRHTGKVVEVDYDGATGIGWRETHNAYYPSPEMHWDAAHDLISAIEAHDLHR